jgi:hypothetical protein
MKGTHMSLRPPSTNYYWNKFKQVASHLFPDQSRLPGALKSAAQGAAIALSTVVIVSTLIAFVLLLSQKSTDLVSVLLAGVAVTLGSFGAVLVVDPSISLTTDLGSDVNFGLHSVTIAAITLAIVYSVSRKVASASRSNESYDLSPLHLGLGFALMTFGISYVSTGVSNTTSGQVNLQGITLLSTLFVFAIVWASSYAGQARGLSGGSDFDYVWKWITKAIKNFVLIYTVLIVFAFIVLIIRTIIEPKYAVASEPVAMTLNLTPDQSLWIFVGVVLYGANLLVQFFLSAVGINVGLEIQGSSGVVNLLSSIDSNVLGNASQWSYSLLGPWGYIGVLVLVTIVALVSGARAADQVGAKFHGVSTYFKALFIGLFVSLSTLFVASVQLSVNLTPLEGESISGGFVWGASLLGVIAFATALIFVAHQSAGRSFDYMASAFPKLVLGKRESGLNGPAFPGARLFGLVTISAILLVAATPIAASSTNRISALVDGPVQVGEKVSKTLTSATIRDLKEFLNPKGSTSSKWLSSKVLEAAQPFEGYTSKVIVTNSLDKSWEPGNLDATIVIELEKDGKTISKTFETTSTLTTNGLLNHVKYEPVIAPTTVEVTLSKFLKGQKDIKITLNGEKVKPGKYFAIPGVYKTKAAGYKLVAATESTIYVENESQLVKIGYKVALPEGGSAKLDKAIQVKADKCLKVASSGSGDCVSKKDIVDVSSIASSESAPSEFFDFRDYNFSSGTVNCDAENRKDSLVTAKEAKSTSDCQTDVTFSRDYYKTAKRQVPNYITTEVCVAGYLSPYGYRIIRSSYDWWDEETYYYDTSGYAWSSYELEYDSCVTTQMKSVRDGTRTELIRGSKISTLKMTSSVTKKISVQGSLMDSGEFKVKP